MKKIFFFVILMYASNIAKSEDAGWILAGQLQLRTEVDGRDFSNKTRAINYTNMRTRLSVAKSLFDNLNFFVQIQDSRIFGSEPTTLSSTYNIDLHQAYISMKEPLGIPVNIKAGRFEMNYGTQRFIGAVGWNYVGRSFDGVVLTAEPWVKLDVFALTLKNLQEYISNAGPQYYHDKLASSSIYSLYGFWAKKEFEKSHIVDLFGYWEQNRVKTSSDKPLLSMGTFGTNYNGAFGDFSTMFEAAYQLGSTGDKDISAYLASLQFNYKINTFSIGAGADILSGTDPEETETYNTFAASYGTNHKFYGYMDYFINIPGNTNNLGLRDIYAMLKWLPKESDFNASADFHIFNSTQNSHDNKNSFGNELDLTLNYKFNNSTVITWGGSIFIPGDLMKTAFSTAKYQKEDTGFWTYLMIQANI